MEHRALAPSLIDDALAAVMVPSFETSAKVVFQHNVQFTDIGRPTSTEADALLRFLASRMASYIGDLIEVRVVQASPPFQTLGLYRNPEIPNKDFTARIRGIVEFGRGHTLSGFFSIDAACNAANPAQTSCLTNKAMLPLDGEPETRCLVE